jgi:DNA polymerase-3 subunit alpha
MGQGQDIPVGPGRGSGAGSLVAYSLTITDLDPLRYAAVRALPEPRAGVDARFRHRLLHGPPRRGDPLRAGEIRPRPGGQIITFGALLSKAAVRDVGRVLQMPFGQVDKLSKMIPVEGVKPVSIEKAIAQEEPRRRDDRDRAGPPRGGGPKRLTYAEQDRGAAAQRLHPRRRRGDRGPPARRAGAALPRSALGHAGDPVQHEMGGTGGLVKFDFLGLKTLTVIQNAIDLIHGQGRQLHDRRRRHVYEPAEGARTRSTRSRSTIRATYELYAAAKTGRGVPGGKLGHDVDALRAA